MQIRGKICKSIFRRSLLFVSGSTATPAVPAPAISSSAASAVEPIGFSCAGTCCETGAGCFSACGCSAWSFTLGCAMMSSYVPRSQPTRKKSALHTYALTAAEHLILSYRAGISATGHFHVTDSQKVRTSLSRAHALTANA